VSPLSSASGVRQPEYGGWMRVVLKYPYGLPPMMSDSIRSALIDAGCAGSDFEPVSDTSPRSR
jgi:hypothetical protein